MPYRPPQPSSKSLKTNEVPLKKAIHSFVAAYGLEEKLYQGKLIQNWEELVGKLIASRTRDISLYKGKLFLYIDSPALKQELSILQERLITRLNEYLEDKVIHTLIIK